MTLALMKTQAVNTMINVETSITDYTMKRVVGTNTKNTKTGIEMIEK